MIKQSEGIGNTGKTQELPVGIVEVSNKEEKKMKKRMTIEGMMCEHCEARVKKVLEALDGVQGAIVSHEAGTAIVSLTKDVENEVLKNAVESQDYKVISIQ